MEAWESKLSQLLEENLKNEQRLKNTLKVNENLQMAFSCNRLGSTFLKADLYEKSLKAFEKALEFYEKAMAELHWDSPLPFTNAYFNAGKALSAMKRYKEGIFYYEKCVSGSPFREIKQASLEAYKNACKYTANSHFNNFECLVEAYSELAVNYYKLDDPTNAHKNCMDALNLQPGKPEAIKTLGNVLRQMNRKEEAIEMVWKFVADEFRADPENNVGQFNKPISIDCKLHKSLASKPDLHVVCVKYGKLYGAEYVNKLYKGVKRSLEIPHEFICFTDDSNGLLPEVKVIEIDSKFGGWWSKANIFNSKRHGLGGKMLYIDLDMVITGNLKDIAEYKGVFGILGAENIFCEKRADGYNSSVMIYESGFGQQIYHVLEQYSKYLWKAIMRFDFFLEMMVLNADELQKVFPGQIHDYNQTCKGRDTLPLDCRIVCFPREPKPHECHEPWIKKFWV